jgi:hypothetical protein
MKLVNALAQAVRVEDWMGNSGGGDGVAKL